MFGNETNIIERLKFRKANLSRLTYIFTFAIWITGYFMIQTIEKSKSWANIYYIFGMCFAGISLITAWVIKNDRDKTLSFFKFGLLGYSLFMCLFELLLLGALKGEDDSSAYMILNAVCNYSKIFIPLGMIIWQAKKWTFLTGINKKKRDAMDDIRNHGNDGMN